MILNKTKNGFYLLISISVSMVFLLGSWWLYLVFKLANKLETLNHPLLEGNLVKMIKLEGLTFFIFLSILTVTLLYIYIQDHKKTISLQAFFSSLTHELKTPLASIKLQGQVLGDLINETDLPYTEREKINKYTNRLLGDSTRLENQLDNHLQLSRVERKSPLNLVPINLNQFIEKEAARFSESFKLSLSDSHKNLKVLADEFALQTIFRNLIGNSLRHVTGNPLEITINMKEEGLIKVTYKDNGSSFTGDLNSLGNLFYKHNSPKGSGIGLYLVKNLMLQMKGRCEFLSQDSLTIELYFQYQNDLNQAAGHE